MPVATLSAMMSTMPAMPYTAALRAGIPSPSSAVWYLGPIPVRAYALCILTGVFVAVWWSDRRYRARGGRPELVLDVAIVAVPAGIVGARLYHVISSPDDYFGPNGDLSRIPQTWLGGLGIWGGVAGGVDGAGEVDEVAGCARTDDVVGEGGTQDAFLYLGCCFHSV